MQSNAVKSFELEIDWTAQTILPIEFRGRELQLEARAYQGADPNFQALVLVHRDKARRATTSLSSACTAAVSPATSSIRCAATAIRSCRPPWTASPSSPVGVLIYLPFQEGRGIGLVNKIRAYALQDQGYDTVDANVAIGAPIEARDYDLAAHILFDLGYPEIKLLTNNPAKVEALREEGVDVDRAAAADRQALDPTTSATWRPRRSAWRTSSRPARARHTSYSKAAARSAAFCYCARVQRACPYGAEARMIRAACDHVPA